MGEELIRENVERVAARKRATWSATRVQNTLKVGKNSVARPDPKKIERDEREGGGVNFGQKMPHQA